MPQAPAAPQPKKARLQTSERLDMLRAKQEEMMASMEAHRVRREAASQQLVSHYKGEARPFFPRPLRLPFP